MFSEARTGTLLKMLYSVLEENDDQSHIEMFENFLNLRDYPELFFRCEEDSNSKSAKSLSGKRKFLPIPELVPLISTWGWKEENRNFTDCKLNNLR